MPQITKEQIKRLNALGAASGIKTGTPDDDYHAVIFRLTGKGSTKDLTDAEFTSVERELIKHMRGAARLQKPRRTRDNEAQRPGMMTSEQQKKAWALIYQLENLDTSPGKATPGERMLGAVRKILEVDATLAEPFRWVSFVDGTKLINKLKRYVLSAEIKRQKASGG